MLGEATCLRSAHGPTSSGFHLGVAVRAHLHLMPSLLLSCRTCFTACAGCPVSSFAWLPEWLCLSLMGVIGGSRLSSYSVDAAMQIGCGEAAWAGKRQASSAKRRAPSAKRQAPSAKRQAPSAKRQAASGKRQTPSAKRQAPSAKRQAPSAIAPSAIAPSAKVHCGLPSGALLPDMPDSSLPCRTCREAFLRGRLLREL